MSKSEDMPADNYRRPTVAQQDHIIAQLQAAYTEDLLSLEEFERRLDAVHRCTNTTELTTLVQDIPAPSPFAAGSRTPVREHSKEHATILAILGGAERRGAWNPARRTHIVTVMGGADLDFSNANLPPGRTDIWVFCVMGGIDIVVPPDVNVEVSVLPIMGGIDHRTDDTQHPNAPTLRIHGAVIMGGIDIKPPKKRKLR